LSQLAASVPAAICVSVALVVAAHTTAAEAFEAGNLDEALSFAAAAVDLT
jgi:hypothetical protein